MSESGHDWRGVFEEECGFLERHIASQRALLIAGLVALSSAFWGLIAILESNKFAISDIDAIAPYFVSVIVFGMSMVALKVVYLRILMPMDDARFVWENPFSPSDLVGIVIKLGGIGAAAIFILSISTLGILEFVIYGLVFGYVMVVLGLHIWFSLAPQSRTNAVLGPFFLLDPRQWTRHCFAEFGFFFIVAVALLAIAWHQNDGIPYVSCGAFLFLSMALIGVCFDKYGATVESAYMLGTLRSVMHWIVGESPTEKEISGVYLGLFKEGKPTKGKRRKRVDAVDKEVAKLLRRISSEW